MWLSTLLVFMGMMTADPATKTLDQWMDNWHKSAGSSDFNAYFDAMDASFVYIGTAPGERWTKETFALFAKPYFEKGKGWDFKVKTRNWKLSEDGNVAWCDEVLSTWMEDCSGTAILVKKNNQWKIVFYDLHVLMENEKMDEFLKLRRS